MMVKNMDKILETTLNAAADSRIKVGLPDMLTLDWIFIFWVTIFYLTCTRSYRIRCFSYSFHTTLEH